MQGDAIELIDTLNDNSIDMVLTSPPYYNLRNYGFKNMREKAYEEFILKFIEKLYPKVKDTGSFILNINDSVRSNKEKSKFIYAIPYLAKDWKFYDCHFWIKKNGKSLSRKGFTDNKEFCYIFGKDLDEIHINILREPYRKDTLRKYDSMGIEPNPDGRIGSNIFYIAVASEPSFGHPAPFPVKFAERFVKIFSNVGDTVLDPFMGSGTTGVASLRLGRKFIGFDINPDYIKIAEERLKNEGKQLTMEEVAEIESNKKGKCTIEEYSEKGD